MASASGVFNSLFLALLLSSPARGGFLDDVQDKLNNFINNNFGSAKDMIRNMTSENWQALKVKDYKKLGGDKIRELLSDGRSTIPVRAQSIMKEIRDRNSSFDQINSLIRSPPSGMSKFQIQGLINTLKPPETWTKDNLTTLNNGLLKLPDSQLLRIDDKMALAEVKTKVDRAVGAERDIMEQSRLKSLQDQIFRKFNGAPEDWTNDSFIQMKIEEISPDVFERIPAVVLSSRKTEIVNEGGRTGDQERKRMYLKRLLELENIKSLEDPQTVMSKLNSFSTLKTSVMPEDLTEAQIQDSDIAALLHSNVMAAVQMEVATPQASKMIMQKFAMMKNITSDIVTSKGVEKLGLVLPNDLEMAKKNKAFTVSSIKVIVDGMRNFWDTGAKAKLQTLADVVEEDIEASGVNEPTLSTYPEEVIAALQTDLFPRVRQSEAKAILRKDPVMDGTKTAILLDKLSASDYKDLSTDLREWIPLSKMETVSQSVMRDISNDLMPGTAITMKTAEKFLDDLESFGPTDVTQMQAVLPFIGAKEAHTFKTANILESLGNMKDINPGIPACMTLKKKIDNFTKTLSSSSWNEKNPISYFENTDIENLPVCVIAAYGPIQMSRLSNEKKRILLQHFGMLKNPELSIMRPNRMAIVKEGLLGMRPGSAIGLMPGDLTAIGNALADVPAPYLHRAKEEIMFEYVMKLNDLVKMKRMRPCLGIDQKFAIAEMIKRVKRDDVSERDTVSDICCLMWILIKSDLRSMKPEVVTSCTCDTMVDTPSKRSLEALCKADLGADYEWMNDASMDLKEVKMEATLDLLLDTEIKVRKNNEMEDMEEKRETTMEDIDICNRAAYGGANAFSVTELMNINATAMFQCLTYFGSYDMETDKALLLASAVRSFKNSNLKDLTAMEVEDLGFILKGFSGADLGSLPNFQYGTYDNVVAKLGAMTVFTDKQARVLASKVTFDWENPSQFKVDDLLMVNQLVCSFEATDINGIPVEAFKGAVGALSKLQNCKRDPPLIGLAKKAEEAFGQSSEWDKSEVAALGVIVAGMRPEDLNDIPPESMEGLSAAAVVQLDSDSICSLTAEDLAFMSPSASLSFSTDQMEDFSPEMVRIHQDFEASIRRSDSLMNEANCVTLALLFLCVQLRF